MKINVAYILQNATGINIEAPMINFPGGPYRPPRRAHDVNSVCPWCGAEKSFACEFGKGDFCPWEKHQDDIAEMPIAPPPPPSPPGIVWPWQYKAYAAALERGESEEAAAEIGRSTIR